ncbi:MAG: hypothetical protein RBR02_10165 [Desulfuromonadaceae bacterium]|nr:hypothetical protein [Desulfuromonadaceae bacterium]
MYTGNNGVSYYKRGRKYYSNSGWSEREISKKEYDENVNRILEKDVYHQDIKFILTSENKDMAGFVRVQSSTLEKYVIENELRDKSINRFMVLYIKDTYTNRLLSRDERIELDHLTDILSKGLKI